MNKLGEYGRVVVWNVDASGKYCRFFGGPSHDVYVLRRIWKRGDQVLATLERRYNSDDRHVGEFNGYRKQVDLRTGRSTKPDVGNWYLQIAWYREDGRVRVPEGTYASEFLCLAEIRRLAGLV